MRQFTFRLEAIRSLREQAEQRAKEELARELDARAAREAELSRARDGLAVARAEASRSRNDMLDGTRLLAQQAFLDRRAGEERHALLGVAQQEQQVERRRGELEERARERELIERLRERRLREHELAAGRAEQAVLAEVALAMHRRRGEERAA